MKNLRQPIVAAIFAFAGLSTIAVTSADACWFGGGGHHHRWHHHHHHW